MTNKIYYLSKNSIACIAFTNWVNKWYFPCANGKWTRLDIEDGERTTAEIYYIWENLNVDENE